MSARLSRGASASSTRGGNELYSMNHDNTINLLVTLYRRHILFFRTSLYLGIIILYA